MGKDRQALLWIWVWIHTCERRPSLVHPNLPRIESIHLSWSLMNEERWHSSFCCSWKSIVLTQRRFHVYSRMRLMLHTIPRLVERGHARQFLSRLKTICLQSFVNIFKMERYSGWRRAVAIAFYILSIITFVSSRSAAKRISIIRACVLTNGYFFAVGEFGATGVRHTRSNVGHYATEHHVNGLSIGGRPGCMCNGEIGHCCGELRQLVYSWGMDASTNSVLCQC